MMESIEKLRESLKACTSEAGVESNRFDTYWITARACDMLIDEIEAEIAEKYMELPVDADGVPIRVGDMVSLNGREPFEVGGVRDTRNQWHVFPYDLQRWYAPLDLHHVKPRTIEDVLREFAEKCAEGSLVCEEADVRKYAGEIRELMEVDA